MKRITFFLIFAILLIVFQVKSQSFSYEGSLFRFKNKEDKYVYAPSSSNWSRSICFVDHISYQPAGDDDFGYKIYDYVNNKYRVKTVDGNNESSLDIRLTTWVLPNYVQWIRKEINLDGSSDENVIYIKIPENCSGFPIVEVLSYMPGGDDEYSYAIRAYAIDSYIVVSAFSAFGNSNSRSIFRVTALYWPSALDVKADIQRISISKNKTGTNTMFLPGYAWFTAPTTYWGKDAEELFKKYDDSIKRYVVQGNGLSTNALNLYGLVINTPFGPVDIDLQTLFKVGKAIYDLISGWSGDDCDDDFWIRTAGFKLFGIPIIQFFMGDENDHSYAELTACSICFPNITDICEKSSETVSSNYSLSQNYPNPFNPSTTIKFSLGRSNYLALKVYNIIGERVATLIDGEYSAGTYEINWNAEDLPGGLYFCRMETGEYTQTMKMTLVK